jgi:hypothetical protein
VFNSWLFPFDGELILGKFSLKWNPNCSGGCAFAIFARSAAVFAFPFKKTECLLKKRWR